MIFTSQEASVHGDSTVRSNLINARLLFVYFAALTPSLGTALAAFGRLGLYMTALCVILASWRKLSSTNNRSAVLFQWQAVVFAMIAYMALTILWTNSEFGKAVDSWVRYSRFLTLVVVWYLIRSREEAQAVLKVFILGQLFVVASSFFLVWGITVPWATARTSSTTYAVFGSYLEQSVTEAVLAFILWFQRDTIFGKKWRCLAIAASFITIIHVVGFLNGRTGHAVVLALLCLAAAYKLPRKWLPAVVLLPVIFASAIFIVSKTARDRALIVERELVAYNAKVDLTTSVGQRLNFWHTSVKVIAEKPITGHGAGSWNVEYRRLMGNQLPPHLATVDNPHQVFLLWAVEGGLTGLLLFGLLIYSLLLKSRTLGDPDAQTLQSALLAMCVAGLFNSTPHGIGIGDFFCVLLGIMLASGSGKVSHPQTMTS